MNYITDINCRPYRLFMDSVGTGKKKKGLYILKNGTRKYVNRKIILNRKKYKKRNLNTKTINKIKIVNKKAATDILNSGFNKAKIGKLVQDTFKNIKGDIQKIGEINNTYYLQKDINELKKDNLEIKTIADTVKNGENGIQGILKTQKGRDIYAEILKNPNVSLEDALKNTFEKYEEETNKLVRKNEQTEKKNKMLKTKFSIKKNELKDLLNVEKELNEKKNMLLDLDFYNNVDKKILEKGNRNKFYDGLKKFTKSQNINIDNEIKDLKSSGKNTVDFLRKKDDLVNNISIKLNMSKKDIYGPILDLNIPKKREIFIDPEISKLLKEQKEEEEEGIINLDLDKEDLGGCNACEGDLVGMNSTQINEVVSKFPKLKYIGTLAYDQLWQFLNMNSLDDFSCIYNSLESANKQMGHWIAFNCDKATRSIEINDSLGNVMGIGELRKLEYYANKISPEITWKIKINDVKQQSSSTDTCGWFCINFLMLRRLNKVSFKDATEFSNIKENEKNISKLKNQFPLV